MADSEKMMILLFGASELDNVAMYRTELAPLIFWRLSNSDVNAFVILSLSPNG